MLGVGVATIAVLGALIVWHLLRRGRLIREGLSPPRPVQLPVIDPTDQVSEPETRGPESDPR